MASPIWTPEFRAQAVRIALTSGLPCRQVEEDLGVRLGMFARAAIVPFAAASKAQPMQGITCFCTHIRELLSLSLSGYSRPRVTEELKEVCVDVGHRRVGRIMRENGIRVERSMKY